MSRPLVALFAGLLWLAGCSSPPLDEGPPSPALWEVTAPGGQRGWLFGTIHALPPGATWRTEAFGQALSAARLLVLEVPNLDDRAALGTTLDRLARTPALGPVSSRVDPADAAEVRAALERAGLSDASTGSLETWAVALTLNAAAGPRGEGVEQHLLAEWRPRAVAGLETVADQLGAFDRLPPQEQSAMLVAVVEEVQDDSARRAMVEAWRKGDIAAIEAETREGSLARPALREALLVGRNRAWLPRVESLVAGGAAPFIAVGAGHVVGPDGLPALLEARGFTVRRIQ